MTGQEREALEAALEFIQTVESWTGTGDPEEIHEVIAQIEAALNEQAQRASSSAAREEEPTTTDRLDDDEREAHLAKARKGKAIVDAALAHRENSERHAHVPEHTNGPECRCPDCVAYDESSPL